MMVVSALVSTAQEPAGEADPDPAARPDPAADLDSGAAGGGSDFEAFAERLREEFPDRRSVEERGDALVAALREFLSGSPDGSAAARARLLLAEVLALLHQRAESVDLLEEVARFGPGDENRARALYLLGEGLFLREVYLQQVRRSGREVPGAADFWRRLATQFADSPLARGVARPLRYFDLLEGSQKALFEAPSFDATFEVAREVASDADGTAVEFSSAQLRGKVVVLDFWRSSTQGQDEFERSFARELLAWEENEPGLRGRYQILGINLDRDRELFERARAAWEIPWPQLHDGRGFATPLAEIFAIPRLPHRVVISTEGHLVFIGADYAEFADAINGQLEPFTR